MISTLRPVRHLSSTRTRRQVTADTRGAQPTALGITIARIDVVPESGPSNPPRYFAPIRYRHSSAMVDESARVRRCLNENEHKVDVSLNCRRG